MSKGLLLLIAASDRPEVTGWARFDGAGGTLSESGMGLPAATAAGQGTIVLVLPGTMVTTTLVQLPHRLTAQVRQALPLLMEDQLAQASDAIHCAVGPKLETGQLVAIVARHMLEQILSHLDAQGLAPDMAVADYMLMPTGAGQAWVAETEHGILAALPDGRGCALDRAVAPALLAGLLEGAAAIIWYGATELPALAGTAERRPGLSMTELWQLFARGQMAGRGINLLQGPFKPRTRWHVSLPYWRRTAALASAAALLVAVSVFAQGWQMNRQAEAIDRNSQAAMQAVFPGVRNFAHMRAKIREQENRGSDRFLALAQALFAASAETEGISLARLEYDNRQNRMLATVWAPEPTSIEALKAALAGRGTPIQIEENAPRQVSGHIEVTLILEPVS